MCFAMYASVGRIKDPDVTRSFDVFKVANTTVSAPDARQQINAAIKLWIHQQIIGAVLEEAAKFDKKVVWTYGESAPEVPDRAVVFTTPIGQRYLDIETVHPDQMLVTHDLRMQGKTVVLQLKDFSHVVMYSVRYRSTAEAYLHADVRIKFGIEAENATVYNCTTPIA